MENKYVVHIYAYECMLLFRKQQYFNLLCGKVTCVRGQRKFEDTKGVIKRRKSMKNRQHNDQKKKHKRTNNDL
jgi:hypothetical protein